MDKLLPAAVSVRIIRTTDIPKQGNHHYKDLYFQKQIFVYMLEREFSA